MKKLISALLAVSSLTVLVACNNEQPKTETYVVRFEQSGQNVIEKEVKVGDVLLDVPTPAPVEGYDVAWDVTDFSTINQDTTIQAILTAKEYEISFDAGEGVAVIPTQKVTFEQPYTLAHAVWEDYVFGGWKLNGEWIENSGVWKHTTDVSLTATWKCTVSFVNGADTVSQVLVDYCGNIQETQIPELPIEEGYSFAWDNLTEQITQPCVTVNAIKTANTYKIYYGKNFPTPVAESGLIFDEQADSYYQTVRFGEEYTLYQVDAQNGKGAFWTKDGKRVDKTGVYQTLGDIHLEIEWVTYADDDDWSNYL